MRSPGLRLATARLTLSLLTVVGGAGCEGLSSGPRLADLEGPLATAAAPGPWAVQVLAEGGEPSVFWALDDGPEQSLDLRDLGDGVFSGALPDAPVGSLLRYRAALAGVAIPAEAGEGDGRRLRVTGPANPLAPPRPCQLRMRESLDSATLTPADDGRPEAGLQVAVVVDGDLADGERARLLTRFENAEIPEPSGGYVAVAEGGAVGFLAVSLRPGRWLLAVEAVPAAGRGCQAELSVTVGAPPP